MGYYENGHKELALENHIKNAKRETYEQGWERNRIVGRKIYNRFLKIIRIASKKETVREYWNEDNSEKFYIFKKIVLNLIMKIQDR